MDILVEVSCKQLDLGIQGPRMDSTGDTASGVITMAASKPRKTLSFPRRIFSMRRGRTILYLVSFQELGSADRILGPFYREGGN